MEILQEPSITLERTNKPIVRPTITINPIGHVLLTSRILVPRESPAINPMHILFYHFRIIDVNIGMIQRLNTSKDGEELWSRVQEFTGEDVLSRKVRYVANIMQPENFQPKLRDTVLFQVAHINNINEQAILELPVSFDRIGLNLTRNEPLTIFQTLKATTVSASHENCITRWNLEAQASPCDLRANIYFTITKMPKHGHIYLLKGSIDKVYLGVGSVFQQSDVNLGQLFYKFRRVIDDWSSATMRIDKGLIYVKDEFRFRIHVHSYRPSMEHVFNIDILENSDEPSTSTSVMNLPLHFRKQVGVIHKSGVLVLQSPLIEVKESRCLKLPNFNFKSSPTFEYMIEVLSKPHSGMVHILKPDGACSINTNVLPVSLLSKGMLVYVQDGSYNLNDEFKFRIICHDTRGLFESVADDQLESRLLILKQMIRGIPPIGNPFTEIFHIRVQPGTYLLPEIDLQLYDGRFLAKIPKDFTRPQNRLYLSCPQTDSSDDCTGGYITEQGKGALLSTIALSTSSQRIFTLLPQKTGTFCARCFVSDGLYSFHKEVRNSYFKMVVDLQREVSVSTTINGTTFIFFKMAHSEDVKPEDIFVRVVRAPTSSGCILLDNRVTDKFDYAAVLRYRVLYWQCKPIRRRLFGISDLGEMQTATLLNSTLSVEKFDALSLEVTSLTPQGDKWSGRVDVKVKLIMSDLSSLDEFQMHPSIQTPLIRINTDPLLMVLGNPKVFEVRISLSPIQLRDILPRHVIDLPQGAFYKVLEVPCQCKLVMFVSRMRVDNVMTFSSSDLMEGRVYLIPSKNCGKETVDSQLDLLQQVTNTRGITQQQPLRIRINISPRRHSISISGIIKGEVETRVPRQKIVFFVLVRGVPVHLVRFEPPQVWRGSVVEISSPHLAAQLTAAYVDLEAKDYIPIEYRIKSLQGGVISSSASEVVPISVFTDQDIRQRRVIFHHDEKSPDAFFKLTLVHGDYESPVHQFSIGIKSVKNLSFKINQIVGHEDSLTKVSITNINAFLVLDNNETYDLIRACEHGGLQVSYKVLSTQASCNFVLRMDYSNSTLRTDSFTQCDIYRGQVQISCGAETPSTIPLLLKAQAIEPISSTIRRTIYNSDTLKLTVVIREGVDGVSRKIAHVNAENPEGLNFEKIMMYDAGYTGYQVSFPMESSVYVMKSLPIYGDILCDSKMMKIGDALCKSPVYKPKGGAGILDKISFESEIDGAIYTITKFPTFGGVYLNGSLTRLFSSSLLEKCEIFYERNIDYLSDFTRDHFHVVVCTDWPECRADPLALEFQVDAIPEEKRVVFRDIVYDPQKKDTPIEIGEKSVGHDTFLLALEPKFGRILSDNVEILKLDSIYFSNDRISYYRTEKNISNDEFILQRHQPPLVMIFRVISGPLIRFKTLYVPHGKEFALNARMIDLLPLLASINRLKKNGFIDTNVSLQQALRFSVSRSTSIGKFTKSQEEEQETDELRFTYKELSDEVVKFKNYDNITVRTTSEDIKVSIVAPMFLAPQKIPIKISIMSTQYNVQDNILLSDFVDEIGTIDSPVGTPIYGFTQRESDNLKIWFAIAIGIVCFIVCIFVTAAYFYLRRWRNQRRIQARCTTEPIVYVDSYQPKSSRLTDRENESLPSPIMLVPLSVIGSQSTNLQTSSEAVLTDQIVHWERQNIKQNIPVASFYVIRGEAIAEDEETGTHPTPCIVSKTSPTTIP
ncbi:hypothetical protein Aperf_G00000044765 [Anoplocephala perfoliata]